MGMGFATVAQRSRAHAFIQHRDQIRYPVWNRGVDRIASNLCVSARKVIAVLTPAIRRIAGLGDGNNFGKIINGVCLPGCVADDHFDELFKCQHPEWQLKVFRCDDLGGFSETLGILIMRIKEQYVSLLILLKDRSQNYGDAAGFTRARAAQDGAMLAQKFIHLPVCSLAMATAPGDSIPQLPE